MVTGIPFLILRLVVSFDSRDDCTHRHLQDGRGDPGVLGDVSEVLVVCPALVGRREDELRLVVVPVGDTHVHLREEEKRRCKHTMLLALVL